MFTSIKWMISVCSVMEAKPLLLSDVRNPNTALTVSFGSEKIWTCPFFCPVELRWKEGRKGGEVIVIYEEHYRGLARD